MTVAEVPAALEALHAAVDADFARSTAAVRAASGVAVGCGPGCSACCQDGLRVFAIEADRIATWVRAAGVAVVVHDQGRCAFLDASGRCQVFAARPYVCRSQGAVLEIVDADNDDDASAASGPPAGGGAREGQRVDPGRASHRATCSEHLHGVALDSLPADAVLRLGVREPQLVTLATLALAQAGGRGLPARVSLRQLARRLAARPPRRRSAQGG